MSNDESFHDTIGLSEQDRVIAERDCRLQEDLVKQAFTFACGKGFTASEMQAMTGIRLITSVRRALCNLVDQEVLVKTELLRAGPHGKPEHIYILKSEYKEPETLFDQIK